MLRYALLCTFFYFNINTIVSRFALICASIMNSFQQSISNHRNGKVFVAVLNGTYKGVDSILNPGRGADISVTGIMCPPHGLNRVK